MSQPGADQWGQSQDQNITPVGGAPAPSRSRSRAVPVVAGIAGAAVVLGAAGALAAQRLSPQAGDPEDILPASTMAFVKVDLDPSIGQKVAYMRMRDLIAKEEKDVADAKEPADLVCKAFLEKLDCDADVKPWLGDRFAMAAWPSGSTESPLRGVVVLKAKDAEKAKAAAQKQYPSAVVTDDFLVLDADEETPSAGSLEADTKAAGTLAEKTEYKDDVAKLDLDSVANVWVDLKPIMKVANDYQEKSTGADKPAPSLTDDALGDFVDEAAGLGGTGVDPLSGWDSQRMEKVTGRVVGGLSVKDDGLKMRLVTLDVTDGSTTFKDLYGELTPGMDSLGQLPGDAQAAFGMSGLGDALRAIIENPKESGLSDADVESIKNELAEVGISVPDDFPKLLGSQSALSLSMASSEAGSATLRLKGADDATVAKLVARAKQELAGDPSAPGITQARDGDSTAVTFALDAEPATGVGQLKDSAKFKRALPDLDKASIALYVDMAGLGAKVNEPDLTDAGYLGLTGAVDVNGNVSTIDVDWVLE